MKADPEGLAVLASCLAAAAAQLGSVRAAGLVHPPLASDPVSVGAAARLTAGASALAGNVEAHGGDVAELAARLAQIAALFAAQEAGNHQALTALACPSASCAAAASTPPLVRPPVIPDVRPPLMGVPPPGGEVFAAQLHAGSGDAGEAFGESCGAAAAVLRGVADQLRRGAQWLPQVWRSTVRGAALNEVFVSRAETFEQFAGFADHLSSQGGAHAAAFGDAQRSTPTPEQFASNRQQLAAAQANNAATGGLWSGEVARLTGERGRLEAAALGAHSTYSQDSGTATDPGPVAGTLTQPPPSGGGGQSRPGPAGSGPASPLDSNSAGLQGDPGGGLESAGLDDPMIRQLIPALMAAVVGGAGGLVGGLVHPLVSAPEQLVSAGSSAAQGLTQGLGAPKGTAPDFPKLDTPELPSGSVPTSPAAGGAGGGELPEVGPAGPISSPMAAMSPTQAGSAPAAAAGSAAAPGPGVAPMGPMMPPMGGLGGQPASGSAKADPRKLALTQRPNTERVSGEIDERVEAVAARTRPPPVTPPDEPRKSRVFRITESEVP